MRNDLADRRSQGLVWPTYCTVLDVGKTMYWRVIPGVVVVVVHTDEAPSDADWEAYLQEISDNVEKVRGVLVYTNSAGPSAPQRARSNEAFSKTGADLQTAIMTGSRVVRGMVTALSWALGGKVKAFTTRQFNEAVACLGLDGEDQLKTRVVLKQLARAADLEIDAFADESGQFAKKFKK